MITRSRNDLERRWGSMESQMAKEKDGVVHSSDTGAMLSALVVSANAGPSFAKDLTEFIELEKEKHRYGQGPEINIEAELMKCVMPACKKALQKYMTVHSSFIRATVANWVAAKGYGQQFLSLQQAAHRQALLNIIMGHKWATRMLKSQSHTLGFAWFLGKWPPQ